MTARKTAPRKRTAPKTPADLNILSFNVDQKRTLTDNDKLPFLLGGDPYVLLRPKQYVLVSLTISMEQINRPINEDDTEAVAAQNQAIASSVDLLVSHIEEPGQLKIRRRLADPTDGLDLDNLLPIVQDLVEALSARPTTAQPASS